MTRTPEETFRTGFGETRLGLALVAQSEKGIAAILLGDSKEKLRRELARAFPGINLAEDEMGMADIIGQTVTFIDAPRQGWHLPLDLRGSELQRAVWQALQAIPAGETRSYGALARSLPLPVTAQGVGAACAANVIAVAIPCHRVVKANGSISGYRWGIHRKRRLISMEGVA